MLQKHTRMLKVATRLKIDDVCKVLKRSRDELFEKFVEWSEKIGFKIDGDYLVIDEHANLTDIIAGLDKEFAAWNDKQKLTDGKI
jgi:hypothetical protein